VSGGYQDFYNHWVDKSAGSRFSDKFPYELSLGVNSQNKPLLPFRLSGTSGGILVTRSFGNTFDRILALRMEDTHGRRRGVVLTGQPGTGTSI